MKKLSILAALLLPQIAMAHPGDHGGAGWTHLLSQADHLSTIAMITGLSIAAWLFLRGRS